MARKRRKNKQNKKKISNNHLIAMLLGMLMSAKILIEDGDSEWKKGDFTGLYVGKMAAAIIISAHCAELLLKYKIAQEGHIINRATHDLYYLYKQLNDDSKAAIQKEFDEQISIITLPDGWESVESVFQKTRNACTDWRFSIVESSDIPTIYIQPLYIAATSIYKTIPISELRITPKEITDPVMKADVLTNIFNR